MVALAIGIVRSMLLTNRPIPFERATILTLPTALQNDKTLLVAVLALARQIARFLDLAPAVSVADAARAQGVSRPYVHELVRRILVALEPLADAAPGRPSRIPDASVAAQQQSLAIQNEVLRYRVDHPGAVTIGANGRRSYSPAFRRFILDQADRWPENRPREEFAHATEVPLDTLNDWFEQDAKGLTPPVPIPVALALPRDANPLVVQLADRFARWQGSVRDFVRESSTHFRLLPGQVIRLLRRLGLVAGRKPTAPPRYRGSTETRTPGSILVTDGKTLDIELTASGSRDRRNWQAVVDQATGCHTGMAIGRAEDAAGVKFGFAASVAFLAGKRPDGLLHDGKPIHQDADLRAAVEPTIMIPATPARGQNKAILEGTFSLFEQQVGTLRLDDTDRESLITSAAHEFVRAWSSGTNHAPRPEYEGKSRVQVLRESCPSPEQIERDRRFVERLAARHRNGYRPPEDHLSRALLDERFERWELTSKDADGALRRHLATFTPDAVRRALARFAAKRETGRLKPEFAHRYLAKLVHSAQDEVELEIAERELLAITRRQREIWTAAEEKDLADMRASAQTPLHLAPRLAERAAHAGLPVEAAFWEEALVGALRLAPEACEPIRRMLRRLYEAPVERRLALIDRLALLEEGLA